VSVLSDVGIVVTTLLLGSASIVHATEGDAGGIKAKPGINHNDTAVATLPPPRQAPVDHRQPRISDVPPITLSPLDLELRREDQLIDRKIIICRAC
jgi:hypothetical protein